MRPRSPMSRLRSGESFVDRADKFCCNTFFVNHSLDSSVTIDLTVCEQLFRAQAFFYGIHVL